MRLLAITEKLVTIHECEAGKVKQGFSRRVRPEESKDEATNFSSEAPSKKLDQGESTKLANYFGLSNQTSKQPEKIELANCFGLSSQVSKQDDSPRKIRKYIRKVTVDEQDQGQADGSINNSMTVNNMSTLINIYDPTPKAPRNQVSSAGIEIGMSPDQTSRSNMNLVMHSNMFARGDSVYQNERILPFSCIEEMEDSEDNEREKENNKQVKGLGKKAKMLKAIVDGSESRVFPKQS